MANGPLGQVLRHLCRWSAARSEDASDGGLLTRFLTQHDQAAFSELVRRHGPVVLGVCRRHLPNAQDAEDAFQATFLILAQKASSVGKRESVGSWLYGVALRTALKARTAAARRRAHEREASAMAPVEPPNASWDELRPLLDGELGRLPEKYRAPVILCYLEGKTNEEAARLLGWPVGTLKTRLVQARDLLRQRLSQRGVALSATALAALLAKQAVAAVPSTLADATSEAALQMILGNGAASAEVAALVKGVSRSMLMQKLQVVAAGLLAIALLGAGAVGLVASNAAPPEVARQALAAPSTEEPKADAEPLPAGAVARLGTTRLRHAGQIESTAISPDGSLLASGGQEGIVRLWDVSTGKPVREFSIKGDGSASSKVLETDGYRRVVSLGQIAMVYPALPSLAFSPDGKTLAAACADTTIHIWDVATGKRTQQLKGHKNAVLSVAFAGDSKTLASCAFDRTIRLWDAVAGKELKTFPEEKIIPLMVAITPDGSTLAAWSGQELALFDCAQGKEKARFPVQVNATHHTYGVFSSFGVVMTGIKGLALAPDGKKVAAWTAQQKSTIYSLPEGKEVRSIPAGGAVSFSADGKTLVTAGDAETNRVRLWDVENGKERATIDSNYSGRLEFAGLTRDGKTLAAHGTDHLLRLYDVETRKERLAGTGHSAGIICMAATPDGKLLASGDVTGVICLWDPTALKELRRIEVHGLQRLILSGDGKRLVSNSGGQLKLWDTADGTLVCDLKEPPEPDHGPIMLVERGGPPAPFSLAVSIDGKTLATSQGDVLNLWELATGKHLRKFPKSTNGGFGTLVYSPDGKTLAAGSNKDFTLWEVATGKERAQLNLDKLTGGAAVFSPDGRSLATASPFDKHVRLWDVGSAKELRQWPGAGAANNPAGLAFTTDGKALASVGADEAIHIWDVSSGKELGLLRGRQGNCGGLVVLGSKTLVTGGADTSLLLWDLNKALGK